MEAKESGKRSSNILSSTGGFNRIVASKLNKSEDRFNTEKTQIQDNKKCGWCGQIGHGSRATVKVRRDKCKSFNHVCEICESVGHYGSMCRSKRKQKSDIGALGESQHLGDGNFCQLGVTGVGHKQRKTLPHTAYVTFRGWISCRPEGHPELIVRACTCLEGYQQTGVKPPRASIKEVETTSLPDTGAQLTVAGVKFSHSLGIKNQS